MYSWKLLLSSSLNRNYLKEQINRKITTNAPLLHSYWQIIVFHMHVWDHKTTMSSAVFWNRTMSLICLSSVVAKSFFTEGRPKAPKTTGRCTSTTFVIHKVVCSLAMFEATVFTRLHDVAMLLVKHTTDSMPLKTHSFTHSPCYPAAVYVYIYMHLA